MTRCRGLGEGGGGVGKVFKQVPVQNFSQLLLHLEKWGHRLLTLAVFMVL